MYVSKREIPVVADYDDGEFRVESDVREFRFLLWRHQLLTDRLVLVDVQVVHVRLIIAANHSAQRTSAITMTSQHSKMAGLAAT